MADLESAIAAQRRAAAAFKAAALKVSDAAWNVPRAPGKWTPAQTLDHVAHSTAIARKAVDGAAGIGSIPKFLRPLARMVSFNKVIRNGAFPTTSRSPALFNPAAVPAARPDLITRLDDELAKFSDETRALAARGDGTFEHTFFGRIALADYVMFNAHHLDHHREQLPAP